MPILDINFENWVDSKGYKCVQWNHWKRGDPPEDSVDIQPKGGTLLKMRPLDFHPTLYKQFADIPDNREAHLDFINTFGPITYCHDPTRRYDARDHELFSSVEKTKLWLRDFIGIWQHHKAEASWKLTQEFSADVTTHLVRRQNGGLALRMAPRTLLDAMMLQLGQGIVNERALRTCEWCGGWFEIGTEAKRSSARFCSDRCRTSFHNDRRLKGARQ